MRIQSIILLSVALMVLTGVTASRAEVMVSAKINMNDDASMNDDANRNAHVNFSELNDYGEWVIVPGYGTVWRPDADPDWRPFTYGHWVYTNDGWMWDSDEPFGWIVCHYGNWAYDDDQGWVWLPGYDWSPARVRWHVTDNEIGWAPLFPEPRHGHHRNAIQLQWTFAPLPFFTSVEVHNHLAFRANPASGGVRVQVSAGPPRREFVQRGTRTPIVSIALNKVRVTTHERPLVRVEVQNRERPNVVVPVGPKYKRVTVRSQSKPRSNSSEEKIQVNVREKHENNGNRGEAKIQVNNRGKHENDDNPGNEEDNNGHKKKKVKVHDR